ncbi:MFS general substrate transporter [Thozetella sp. PMI_491]|nr:MFS general substrate transporter [Thozetella sp. PMI_491]
MATVFVKQSEDEKKQTSASILSLTTIPPLGVPNEEKRFWWQRDKSYNPDAIATQPSVFDDPDTSEQYYPKPEWENYKRFDPMFRWTWGEEYSTVRKLDKRIFVLTCVIFVALELDRANLSRALTDNFLQDLNLTTNDYNYGNSIFKLAFMCSEIPAQLICKWIGPDRWVPGQIVLWSIVASCQFWLNGRTSFLICRGLLGVLQAGFIPQIVLFLSYFYKHHELSLRLGFFYTSFSFADIASSLIAYGVLHMRGVLGLAGWRWLFLIEGLMTLALGFFCFLAMPPGPCHTASWFRGREGWFTEKEEKIVVNRVIREDPSKSTMHMREALTPKLFWQSLKDYDLWPIYILGLVFWIPAAPPLQYLTLSLRNLGFDTFEANLLIIPYTVVHIFTMLGLTYLAEMRRELTLTAMCSQLWVLPFMIYLNVADIATINRWVLWTVTTLMVGFPSATPIQQGWSSRNSNAVRARTVSAACYNTFVQAGGLISSNMYRADDAPFYKRGNRQLLAILCTNICLYLLTKIYYVSRNRQKERVWTAMTEDERMDYILHTTDEGNKRLDFRFAH